MNLKTAARRLGIHYQTAYKLVRSGALAAVRVGGCYDISEAALTRYLAERDAVRRAPARSEPFVPPAHCLDATVRDIETVIDTPGLIAGPALEMIADALADHLGDVASIRIVVPGGRCLQPGPVRHRDPRRRALVSAAVARNDLTVDDEPHRSALASERSFVVPHVPQDTVRALMPKDALQYLDTGSLHSLIATPAFARGDAVAVVLVTRDAPGNPYTERDVELVERFAALAAQAIDRARLARVAHDRRRVVLDRLAQGWALDRVCADGPLPELVCDSLARVIDANDAFVALGIAPREDIVGRPLAALVAEDDQLHERQNIARLLVGELSYLDYRLHLATVGEPRPVAAYHGAAHAPDVTPRALVFVAHELH